MANIRIHTAGGVQTLVSSPGETLHRVLARYGVFHMAPCGGEGRCHRCKVCTAGALAPPDKREAELLSDAELLAGVRMCCMARPQGDCDVFLADQTVKQSDDTAVRVKTDARQGAGCGIDIGTTTLAIYLYDRATGRKLAAVSALNRQAVYGADVISRIHAANTMGALPDLQKTVLDQLNELIALACRQAGLPAGAVAACTVAGNTTMLHFLAGLDPAGIAVAPFTPQSLFGTEYRGDQLGLVLSCPVFLAPCISAYVGGDITAGMAACNMDTDERVRLLIDVGTNGEMALAAGGRIYCLSTAAGPAFEGAHIQCGMGGVPGAVCRVTAEGVQTVGDAPPAGICGSGLLDAVALMLAQGAVDETGYLEENFPLTPDGGVYITPGDIRQIQLAKSAIRSGVERLMELARVTPDEVDEVLFAGGFGTRIRPESAAAVGLIPPALAPKCRGVGNTAGQGAVQAALDENFRDRLLALPAMCRYFELSGDERFNQLFMDNMLFEIGE